jgi:hypothetical protein
MTSATETLGHGVTAPTPAIHVTGRRVVATIIDGLVLGVAYWLLALAFGAPAGPTHAPSRRGRSSDHGH